MREIYRDQDVVAFLPTEPATLGHTLVIPRAHVQDIWTLTDDAASTLGRAVTHISRAIRDVVQLEGLNVIQSNGSAASQTVLHLHVHLVPRWSGDAIGEIWPRQTNYAEDQKDDVWGRLRSACMKDPA